MNETRSENGKATPRRGSRKVRLAIAAVALVGLGTAIGVVATEGPTRAAWHGFKEWRHHGHGGSEATVRARAKWISAWVLDEVDATDAQREQIDGVIDDLVTKAWPLREQHRAHHRALIAELGPARSQPGGSRSAAHAGARARGEHLGRSGRSRRCGVRHPRCRAAPRPGGATGPASRSPSLSMRWPDGCLRAHPAAQPASPPGIGCGEYGASERFHG